MCLLWLFEAWLKMFTFARFLRLRQAHFNCQRFKRFISDISTIHRGSANTSTHRIYYANENGPISPFHDIPFGSISSNLINMIVEIPRWTNAKLEISTLEPLNPIKHDVKKGKLRYVANVFPHHGYIWNYGAIPQTWENPAVVEKSTGCKGDNDPVDALELGGRIHQYGALIQVKVLGCLGLIDEGEMDWKLLVVDVTDPLAKRLNDVPDIETVMPGYVQATIDWFRNYKVPTGSSPNNLAFNGHTLNKEAAINLLKETHEQWRKLSTGEIDNKGGIALHQTTCSDCPHGISYSEAVKIVNASPSPGPASPIHEFLDIQTWHFIRNKK